MVSARKLLIVSSIWIAVTSGPTLAQSIHFPIDHNGYADVGVIGNMVELTGVVESPFAPDWETILDYTRIGCAKVEMVEKWDCGNPTRYGHRSLFFYYLIQVTFEQGCDTTVCFFAKSHPEYGQVCVTNWPYQFKAEIRDQCGNQIRYRFPHSLFLDPEEGIHFWVEMTSDSAGAPFPHTIHGWLKANAGCLTPFPLIVLFQVDSSAYRAEYRGGDNYLRNYFYCESGYMTFHLSYAKGAAYSVWVDEVDFSVHDLIFTDTLPLFGTYMHNTVCCPQDSRLSFGTKVRGDVEGWPTDCQTFTGYVLAYDENDSLRSNTNGIITRDYFFTNPAESNYEIHGPDFKDLHLHWKFNVNWVKPRDALSMQTVLHVYHAFRGDSVKITDPDPMPDSISIGDTIRVQAKVIPWLAQQDRIIYDWHVNGPSGGGHFRFDQQTLWHDYFWATQRGFYDIYFTVKDTVNGYSSTSAHKTVHVGGPSVNIVLPADSAKFTFTDSARAALNIMAVATTVPAYLADSLKWTITPIVGSTLRTKPNPPQGDTIWFRYENMPSTNNQFGPKYITAKLASYNVADTVMVKVFFPKYATNNPDAAHDWPNWYYYWKQTSAYVSGRQVFGGPGCNPNKGGYFDPGDTLFHICEGAAGPCSTECAQAWWNGIDVFAASELHENTHLNDWWTFWPGGYHQSADLDPPLPPDTTYGDNVPDSLEGTAQYPNFSPSLQDSDRDGHKDFDDLGYDFECNWIRGMADSLDWAKPGHQY